MKLGFACRVITFALVLIAVSASRVLAASGSVTVTVVDARTHRPVPIARVVLVGPSTVVGYTDAGGTVTFADVAAGDYGGRIILRGYRTAELENTNVAGGGETTISIMLAPDSGPPVIGTVRTSSSIVSQPDRIGRDGIAARLRGSLQDALGDSAAGNPTSTGFSVEGHGPAQTAYQIDGATLPGFGAAGMRSINADLFGSVSVERGATDGNIGGAVNFHTLEPTLNFESLGRLGFDGNGATLASATARGTIGSVGFIASHAVNGSVGQLDGARFSDTSGYDYAHRQQVRSAGSLLKLRVPLSRSQSISATYVDTATMQDETCNELLTILPCGFGPSVTSTTRSRAGVVRYSANSGETAIGLTAGVVSSRLLSNDASRTFLQQPVPPAGSFDVRGRIVSLSAGGAAGQHHALTFEAQTASYALDPSGAVAGAGVGSTSSWQRYSILDAWSLGRQVSLQTMVADTRSAGAGSLTGGVFASLPAPRGQSFRASASFDRGAGPPFAFADRSAPTQLNYSCSPQAAIGAVAVSDVDHSATARTLRGSWTREDTTHSVSLAAYDTLVHGDTLSSFASPAELGLGADYVASVAQIFHASQICGATPFAADRIFLRVPVSALTTAYRGGVASAAFRVTPSMVVVPFAAAERAYAINVPGAISPSTTIQAGRQLPGVPPFKAGVTIDYRPHSSGVEALAIATYVGANNPRNLAPYLDVGTGLAFQSKTGTLVFRLTNALNAHAARFATAADAVGFSTASGADVPIAGRQLPPRTIGATWTVNVGGNASPRQLAAGSAVGFGDGDSAAYQFHPEPLPSSPPPNALDVNRSSTTCQPEIVRSAQSTLDAVRAIAASVDRRGATSGIETAPLTVPANGGFTATYVSLARSYAIVLVFDRAHVRSLIPCAYLHGTDVQEARQRGLYAGADAQRERVYVYSPEVGLYYVAPSSSEASETVSFRTFGTIDPDGAVAIAPSCPARYAPVARELIRVVGLSLSGQPVSSSQFRAAARGTGEARWLQIDGADALTVSGVAQCLPVAKIARDDARAKQIPGRPFPSIMFSARFGFYVIEP